MFALNSISFCTTLYDFYIWQIEMEGKGFHMKTMLEVSIWYYCDFLLKLGQSRPTAGKAMDGMVGL